MNGNTFEHFFIKTLADLIEMKGLKHAPTAKMAWPESKDPVGKWRKMRNMGQGLGLGDAFAMAQALGLGFTELCGIVQGRVIEEEIKQQPIKMAPGVNTE